jgi:hypothetical protein
MEDSRFPTTQKIPVSTREGDSEQSEGEKNKTVSTNMSVQGTNAVEVITDSQSIEHNLDQIHPDDP